MRWLVPLLLALLLAASAPAPAQEAARPPGGRGPVLQMAFDGPITPASLHHLDDVLRLAEAEDASAILLVLNTPGGGLAETLDMVQRIRGSPVPFLGFVAPSSAHAWSAGTVLLLSTHVAAMAPHTVIGSSQPVQLGEGGFTPVNDSKIVNALVSQLRSLAAATGRNETAAEEFVTKNLNLNADQALAADVIEHVARDVPALLAAADGRVVETAAGNVTLALAGKPVRVVEPSLRVAVLDVFYNPMVAGLLMLVGVYALIFGLGSPGLGVEVAGAIAVLLALLGLGFDVNLVGLGLIALGAALLLFELHTPGFGAFGFVGVAVLVLGTILVAPLGPGSARQWSFPAVYQQEVLLVLALPSLLFAGFLVFALVKVQEARRRVPYLAGLEGQEAVVTRALGPGKPGFVTLQGEEWQAVSDWEVAAGEPVVVRGKDGPVLRVEPAKPRGPSP